MANKDISMKISSLEFKSSTDLFSYEPCESEHLALQDMLIDFKVS